MQLIADIVLYGILESLYACPLPLEVHIHAQVLIHIIDDAQSMSTLLSARVLREQHEVVRVYVNRGVETQFQDHEVRVLSHTHHPAGGLDWGLLIS